MNKGFRDLSLGGFSRYDQTVSHVLRIELDALRPNPFQPRKDFDSPRAQESFEELKDSIRRHGLQTPIHVQKDPDAEHTGKRYIIVAGERRWRALKALGEATIEAKEVQGDPETLALIENIQRADLNAIEEAQAYARLMEKNGWSQGQLAEQIGKKRNTVNEYLQINHIDAELLAEIQASGNLVKSHLIQIGKEKDTDRQRALWAQLSDGNASYLDVKAARAGRQQPQTPAEKAVAALESAHKKIARLETLDPDTHQRLLKIRAAINKLLREKAPDTEEDPQAPA